MQNTRFVWVDLEMTGLDPDSCAIVEMAMIITDGNLSPIAQLERVIWQPPEVLARTVPFVQDMHTKNGLFDKVRVSPYSVADVEREAVGLLAQHVPYKQGILAGNSVHQDRRFFYKYMPSFESFLHYRQIDVSSLKVLVQNWGPKKAVFEKQNERHTALEDIQQSLAEAAHYRGALFGG
jgi:oligoribonuclease